MRVDRGAPEDGILEAMSTQPRRLRMGASWYPEMWPETEWAGDAAKMAELGFNLVRLFEFAWKRFEPREGEYDFDWARRVMDRCHENGVAVVVGTPTAAPPAWLVYGHPDILLVKKNGERAQHGRRKHFSPYSETYRKHARRIVTKMVEELGDHPALFAWQIDNEMSSEDCGEEAHGSFHRWLREKYGDIESLNRAWGLNFWSQWYESFEQVPMPEARVGSIEMPERHHPSLLMAIARHRSEVWDSYMAEQIKIIRAGSGKPVTTNRTPGFSMQWPWHFRQYDRAGISLYQGLPVYHWNTEYYDELRGGKPGTPYWLLECAPNWSATGLHWNLHQHDRGLRNMIWHSYLLGGDLVLFWQWRQHWAGQEMMHGTLRTATGKWRPNHKALQEETAKMARVEDWLEEHPLAPAEVGLFRSSLAAWVFSIDPVDKGMPYAKTWRDRFYSPLRENHIWREVISEYAPDLARYKVLVLPLMPILPGELRKRLEEWVKAGGVLILGPYSGYRTEENTVFTDREYGGLEELMGAESGLIFTVHDQEEVVEIVFEEEGAPTSHSLAFCDGFCCHTAKPLAHYREGYGDGLPAVVENRCGEGTVITVGALLSPAAMLHLLRRAMDIAGVKAVADGSDRVLVAPRLDGEGKPAGAGLVNLSEEGEAIKLPAGGTDLLTGETVDAMVTMPPLSCRLIAYGS